MSNWNSEKINKLTGTKFTPAGYDYQGFNAAGLDRYGYDAGGFSPAGLDKYGNAKGTNLEGYQTQLLTKLIKHYSDESFTMSDVVPSYYPGNADYHYGHKDAFNDLAKRGFIVKTGRRWELVEDKAFHALPELFQASWILVN